MRATLVVLLLLLSRLAHAADVGVVVTGEAVLQPQLAAQLESWLRSNGYQLVPSPLPPEAINTMIDCFAVGDERCAAEVVSQRAKSAVVFARADIEPGTSGAERTVTITVYWFEKDKDVVAERRYCERCTDVTLRSTADDTMAALARATMKDTGRLRLTSTPAGARVLVDGKPVGVTPLDYDLVPGGHKVTLEHDDHQIETRDVTVRLGETTLLDVPLQPGGAANGGTGPLPKVLVGAGAALVVAGAVLFVIDQDPGLDQPYEIRNTAPLGVGLAIAGVATAAFGGYLWARSAPDRESSQPVAAITRDGAYVGWFARF